RLLVTASSYVNEDKDSPRVRVWDVASGKLSFSIPARGQHSVQHVAFSPDNSHLLVVTGPGSHTSGGESLIHIHDSRTCRPSSPVINEHKDHLIHVGYSPDSQTIVSVMERQPARVSVWDASTGLLRQSPIVLGDHLAVEALHASFSPDGHLLVVSGS